MAAELPLHLEFLIHYEFQHINLARIGSLLQFAACREKVRGEVSIQVCDDAEIARLHRQFMGIDGPTDVISFPGGSSEPPAAGFGWGESYLGDITVSYETAEVQAIEAGHSAAREIVFLILHGFLHLAGHDDLGSGQREAMLAYQTSLLETYEAEHPGEWM